MVVGLNAVGALPNRIQMEREQRPRGGLLPGLR